MKSPKGLLDVKGQAAKIVANIKVGDETLREYPWPDPEAPFPPEEGNTSTCFILTSPGDVLKFNLLASPGTADVVDVEVDGILRGSQLISSKNVSNVIIKKVCYMGNIGTTARKEAAKYCEMMVKERNTKHDIKSAGGMELSAVGSLIIKCWRKEGVAVGNHSSEVQSAEADIPTFETHTNWYDLNKHISKDDTSPPFEISFINPTTCSKAKGKGKGPKERVKDAVARKPSSYKLLAVFVFHLRSTADLISLGYDDVPIRYAPPPPPPKPKKGKAVLPPGDASKLKKDDEDQRLSELFGEDDDESIAESSPQPEPKLVEKTVEKLYMKPVREYQSPPRSTLQGLLAHMASQGRRSKTPEPGKIHKQELAGTSQHGHIEAPTAGERAASPNPSDEHSEFNAAVRSTSAEEVLGSLVPSAPPNVEPIELVPRSEQGANKEVSQSIPITKFPVLEGLNAAPAHRAWLERAATQAQDSKPRLPTPPIENRSQSLPLNHDYGVAKSFPTQKQSNESTQEVLCKGQHSFDETLGRGAFSSLNKSQPTVSSYSFRVANTTGDFGLNDSFQCATTVGTSSGPLTSGGDNATSQVKVDSSFNDAASDTTEVVDPADIALGVQRSARPRASSDATEVADPAEVEAALKRSVRSLGLPSKNGVAGENGASQLSMESAHHTFPSPILGSTPLNSFHIRTSSQSPCGIVAQQARIHWSGSAEKQSQPQQSSSPESWPTEWTRPTQSLNHGIRSQELGGPDFDSQVNLHNESSFHPVVESPLPTTDKFSVANTDRRSYTPIETPKKGCLSPLRRTPAVPEENILLGFPVTKRKSEYMTDAYSDHYNHSAKRMAASNLAKKAMIASEIERPETFQEISTPRANAASSTASTQTRLPGRSTTRELSAKLDEFERERLAVQNRLAALEERKKQLQARLDAKQVEKKRREIGLMKAQADELERENAEMEAELEALEGY